MQVVAEHMKSTCACICLFLSIMCSASVLFDARLCHGTAASCFVRTEVFMCKALAVEEHARSICA